MSDVFSFLQSLDHSAVRDENILMSSTHRFELYAMNQSERTDFNSKVIWEDQWLSRPEIVKSRIRSTLGQSIRLHGRATTLQKVSQPQADEFLKENHLLGSTKAKTKLALKNNGKILALATFSGPTKMNREGTSYKSFELIRYCNLNHYTVIGGLTKLLKHFIDINQPDDIMTYVDKDWSTGESFKKLGFQPSGETGPKYFKLDKQMNRYYLSEKKINTVEEEVNISRGSIKLIKYLK